MLKSSTRTICFGPHPLGRIKATRSAAKLPASMPSTLTWPLPRERGNSEPEPGPPTRSPGCSKMAMQGVMLKRGHVYGGNHMSPRSPRNRSRALHINRIKSLAYAKNEYPENDEGDEDREGYGNLHHERHAFGSLAVASTRPFSSDMKPTIWVTALPRVIIINSPSRMTASAKARSSRFG